MKALKQLFGWLQFGGGRLKDRALRGGVWLLIGSAANRLVSVLKVVVLARLLAPHEFGLMAIAILVLKQLELFTQSGFTQALIQKPSDIKPYLDTAFAVQLGRSILLAMVMFLGAPFAGWFFHSPESVALVRGVSAIVLLRGLINPAIVYWRKELDFHREVLWRCSSVIAGFLVAIVLAFALRSAWALVLSLIVTQAMEAGLSYVMHPYRPSIRLDWQKTRELVRYGKWIFCLNVANFVRMYGDGLVVGKMLGLTALGYYQMGQQLIMPWVQAGNLVNAVMFSAFAKVQDAKQLRRALLRTLGFIAALLLPLACFISIFARPIVRVLLGAKWYPVVPLLQVLAWAGAAMVFMNVANAFFNAVGKPKISARGMFISFVPLVILLYPAARYYGVKGAAATVALSIAIAAVVQCVLAFRYVRSTRRDLLPVFQLGIVASIPFLITGVALRNSAYPGLYVGVALAGMAYVLMTLSAVIHFGFARQVPAATSFNDGS